MNTLLSMQMVEGAEPVGGCIILDPGSEQRIRAALGRPL